MRQIDIYFKALNKRHYDQMRFEASLHDKKLKPPPSIYSDAPRLTQEQEDRLDIAMKEAQERKRQEMRRG